MYRQKLSASIFLIIIFTSIVIFSNFLTFSIVSAIKDEKLVNDFLAYDAKHFKILPKESYDSWPEDLFNLKNDYVISKPLDGTGSMIGLFFSNKVNIKPEMEQGRFFNEKDFLTNKKYIVIGRNLLESTKVEKEKRYYQVNGEDYEVIGVMKYRKKYDWNGYKSYINLKSINKNKDLLWVGDFGVDAGTDTLEVYSILKSNIKNAGFEFEDVSKELIKSPLIKLLNNTKFILLGFLITLIVFILNTISVTSYWIDTKMLEIGVKKCCGATNKDISVDILKELTKTTSISFIIGTLIYMTITFILNRNVQIYPSSLLGSFIVILISSVMTSVVPILKSTKVQPISMMR